MCKKTNFSFNFQLTFSQYVKSCAALLPPLNLWPTCLSFHSKVPGVCGLSNGWCLPTTSLFGLLITYNRPFLSCLPLILFFFFSHSSFFHSLTFFLSSPPPLLCLPFHPQRRCPNTGTLDMNQRKSHIPSPSETNQLSTHRHTLNPPCAMQLEYI